MNPFYDLSKGLGGPHIRQAQMGWMLHMSSAVVKPGLPSLALVHQPQIVRLLRGAYRLRKLLWVAVVCSYIGVPLMDTEVRLVGSRKEGSTHSGLDQAPL